ncbi:hypothetical protein KAJ38_01230 [Candidatus Pacearchaeota archaeon]|nr:hypothetical protein [Candidatus Pacearchaeota archaeon]
MSKGKVLLDWMCELSWKQQSAVLSSLRGPDNSYSPNFKRINKWMRRITQNDADASSSYMKDEGLPSIEELKRDIEFCNVHYLSHLLQGLEIVGYNYPDSRVAEAAIKCYEGLVHRVLHLNPETKEQLEYRLRDLD